MKESGTAPIGWRIHGENKAMSDEVSVTITREENYRFTVDFGPGIMPAPAFAHAR